MLTENMGYRRWLWVLLSSAMVAAGSRGSRGSREAVLALAATFRTPRCPSRAADLERLVHRYNMACFRFVQWSDMYAQLERDASEGVYNFLCDSRVNEDVHV